MISIFNGQKRGPGLAGQSVYIQLDVKLRECLHLFKGPQLSVFLAIALHINAEGVSWPSYDTLEKETGYKRASISKALKDLCELKIEGHPVLMKWRERDDKGKFTGSNRYKLFPTVQEVQSSFEPTVDEANCEQNELEEEPTNKEEPKVKEEPLKDFAAAAADAEEPQEPDKPEPKFKVGDKVLDEDEEEGTVTEVLQPILLDYGKFSVWEQFYTVRFEDDELTPISEADLEALPEPPKSRYQIDDVVLYGKDKCKVTGIDRVGTCWHYNLYGLEGGVKSLVEQSELNKYSEQNHTQNAIVAAFKWNQKDVSNGMWGQIRKAAKELRGVNVQPEEVQALYDYCAKRFDDFGPNALPKWVADWSKEQAAEPTDIHGRTKAEVDAAIEATLARYESEGTSHAMDAYTTIMGGNDGQ